MEFSEYQKQAITTAIYPTERAVVYPALGLAGEAGEVAGKIKKVLRDTDGSFDTWDVRSDLLGEIGDVLWYVAVLCEDLGLDLDQVAEANLQKLADRKRRGVLKGSGDNR